MCNEISLFQYLSSAFTPNITLPNIRKGLVMMTFPSHSQYLNGSFSKGLRSLKVYLRAVFVSICSQDYFQYHRVGNMFHKHIQNNLECLEHLRKFDEISYFLRLPSIYLKIESTIILFSIQCCQINRIWLIFGAFHEVVALSTSKICVNVL